jgi:hypothetical protein
MSLEKLVWDADAVIMCGRQHRQQRYRERLTRPTWSETTCMSGNLLNGKREVPQSAHLGRMSPTLGGRTLVESVADFEWNLQFD